MKTKSSRKLTEHLSAYDLPVHFLFFLVFPFVNSNSKFHDTRTRGDGHSETILILEISWCPSIPMEWKDNGISISSIVNMDTTIIPQPNVKLFDATKKED